MMSDPIVGACAGMKPSHADRVFFPNDGNYGEALKKCSACPVKQECAEMATVLLIPHGMFGGETGAARRERLGINELGFPVRQDAA